MINDMSLALDPQAHQLRNMMTTTRKGQQSLEAMMLRGGGVFGSDAHIDGFSSILKLITTRSNKSKEKWKYMI
jgi:hypothetical protein